MARLLGDRVTAFCIQDSPRTADKETVLNKPEKRCAVDVQRHTVFLFLGYCGVV